MSIPLSISDVSLWLSATALILLITSELIFASPKFSVRLNIDRKQLRIVALGCGFGFLVTVVMQVF